MRIGLIDVDSHNWPNLCLMKLSAYHKKKGDLVEWWNPNERYDLVYKSRVFTDLYSKDTIIVNNAEQVILGGTGYGVAAKLPDEIEHSYPDYELYPQFPDTAYGFLTRGCPRNCGFCVVSEKEGRRSVSHADLSEFWHGQKAIKLMDANLLACPDRERYLEQLAESRAYVDFTQGLDCRLLSDEVIDALNRIRLKEMHFAWDSVTESDTVLRGLKRYAEKAKRKPHGRYATVYVLTNFGSTHEQDLFRVMTLRDLGYDPYIMVYDRPGAPAITRQLQRWVNNRRIFRSVKRFEDYIPGRIGGKDETGKAQGRSGTREAESRGMAGACQRL